MPIPSFGDPADQTFRVISLFDAEEGITHNLCILRNVQVI